jgi:hypothetical protein
MPVPGARSQSGSGDNPLEWLVLALFVVAIAAAVKVRRAINDPANPFGQWVQTRVRPWFGRAATAVFIATLVGWALLYASVPEHERKNIGEAFRDLGKIFQYDNERIRREREGQGEDQGQRQ